MNASKPGETLIEARQIEKAYQVGATSLQVLRGITLMIRAGETLAIMGPSGAGKSTLLHVLGGLDRPTRGQVIFKGREFYGLPARERAAIRAAQIGFVFQSYHLLPELTLLENAMLPSMACGSTLRRSGAMKRRAVELLAAVGLAERLTHTPLELSGGEQQRAALARALMNAPEILLADEPTGNLDTATGDQILHYLFTLTRGLRHTLVLVTHNAAVAERCNRAIHLVDGKISAER